MGSNPNDPIGSGTIETDADGLIKTTESIYENQSPDLVEIMAELLLIFEESDSEHRRTCLSKTMKLLAGRQEHLDRMA